jgi:hypothetical protein
VRIVKGLVVSWTRRQYKLHGIRVRDRTISVRDRTIISAPDIFAPPRAPAGVALLQRPAPHPRQCCFNTFLSHSSDLVYDRADSVSGGAMVCTELWRGIWWHNGAMASESNHTMADRDWVSGVGAWTWTVPSHPCQVWIGDGWGVL